MKALRNVMKICRRCRDFFSVWGSKLDERLGLLDKNTTLNPNWSRGGDRRSINAKPIALKTKKQAEQLRSPTNSPRGSSISERSFHIPDENYEDDSIQINHYEPEANEAPEDAQIGLEDPYDANDNHDVGDEDDGDDSDQDDQNLDRNDPADPNPGERNDEDIPEEPSTIYVNNSVDASFLKGKLLVLKVTDGDKEVPQCALCHQLAFEGEIITNILEHRLRH